MSTWELKEIGLGSWRGFRDVSALHIPVVAALRLTTDHDVFVLPLSTRKPRQPPCASLRDEGYGGRVAAGGDSGR